MIVYIEETRCIRNILTGKSSQETHITETSCGEFLAPINFRVLQQRSPAFVLQSYATSSSCLCITSILQVCQKIKRWWAGGRTRSCPRTAGGTPHRGCGSTKTRKRIPGEQKRSSSNVTVKIFSQMQVL